MLKRGKYSERSRACCTQVETSDRQVNDETQWKPLPIQTAAANEVPALAPMIPKLESELAEAAKG